MSFLRMKRLQAELKLMNKDPLDTVKVTIKNDNVDSWYVKIYNLPDEEYKNGEYILEIIIPSDYPQRAPDFMMLTPSGRFDINRKLCFSNSGYHPESWSPIWNMKTIIVGFVSFFLEKSSVGIGHITCTSEQRIAYAQSSIEYNKNKFPNIVFEEIVKEEVKPSTSNDIVKEEVKPSTSNNIVKEEKVKSSTSKKKIAKEVTKLEKNLNDIKI